MERSDNALARVWAKIEEKMVYLEWLSNDLRILEVREGSHANSMSVSLSLLLILCHASLTYFSSQCFQRTSLRLS